MLVNSAACAYLCLSVCQDSEPTAAATAPALIQAAKPKEEDPEEQAELMEEDKPQPEQEPAPEDVGAQQTDKAPTADQAEAETGTQAEAQKATQPEAQKAAEPTAADKPEAAKEEEEQEASPMDTVEVGGDEKKEKSAGGHGRGVKRPSAPVARVAKQARTNQAAGEQSYRCSFYARFLRPLLRCSLTI